MANRRISVSYRRHQRKSEHEPRWKVRRDFERQERINLSGHRRISVRAILYEIKQPTIRRGTREIPKRWPVGRTSPFRFHAIVVHHNFIISWHPFENVEHAESCLHAAKSWLKRWSG